MSRFCRLALVCIALATLIACKAPAPPAPARAVDSGTPAENLHRLVERYWDENATLTPWFSAGGAQMQSGSAPALNLSAQSLADALALERRYLALLLALPRAALGGDSAVTYDIFRRERELAIEGFTYPVEMLPINAYDGMPQRFAVLAAQRRPLASVQEHADWQALELSFVEWTHQAIVNMREGMRRGYTLPRVSVEKTLPLLAALGEDTPANIFYLPLRSAVPTEGSRPSAAETALVKDKLLPSLRALHDFLRQEYLPRSRLSVGLSTLPLGESWYVYLTKRATGGAQTPAELHALGLAEVARLNSRIQSLLTEASFAGNAQSFLDSMRRDPRFSYTTALDLLHAYQDLKEQAAAAGPAVFAAFPQSDFDLKSVEKFRADTAPALSYWPRPPNGMTPAVVYVNTAAIDATRPVTQWPARFLREASPGHHYQLELQRERADLPKFRRVTGAPAFIEGWALYAATLGDELGLYRDPETKFGSLLAQLDCAAGLVVDTGVHARGWSRQQALEFLRAAVPTDDAAAAETVDRAIALPAQALACTVGFLEIEGLRARAQQTLGEGFDLREFHSVLLRDGAVPLDILDVAVSAWMVERLHPPGGDTN